MNADAQLVHFTPVTVGYTALGTVIFWSIHGRKKLKVYLLSDLFNSFGWAEDGISRNVVEFILFVVIGLLVGVGVIGPSTIPQAFSAGLAWTGVVAKRA